MASKIRKIFNLIIAILILLPTESYAVSVMDAVRTMVSKWYFIFRYLSIAIMLVVLIYLGIKLAISSIAEEKAKCKRMLVDWVVGFAIIFLIHYYMVLVLSLNNSALGLVNQVKESLWEDFMEEGELKEIFLTYKDAAPNPDMQAAIDEMKQNALPSTENLYEVVRTRAYQLGFSVGTTGMIMYMVLVYYTIKFAFIYFKRFFTLLILTIIAPVMGLFYAFNKITSGKAVTFGKWASEYAFNVMLQTIHAIAYTVFVYLAITLSIQSIAGFILAMVMLSFMADAEKIMRKIFKISGGLLSDTADKGIKENLATATAMKASMGVAFGNEVAKGVGNGIKSAMGAVGNIGASAVLKAMNYGVDDKKLKESQKELDEEYKKDEKDRSAEKIKKLENTIAEISALKANVQKYRGGIKDPEKLQAKIDRKTKGITDPEERQRIEDEIREKNERSIVKRDKFKDNVTKEIKRVSIGQVMKSELNEAFWGNDEIKDATKEMFKTTIDGLKGIATIMVSIPMIIEKPSIGMAVLSKGVSKAKKMYGNDYNKSADLGERYAIRKAQIKNIKKRKEERLKLKKQVKTEKRQRRKIRRHLRKTGSPRRLTFNRYGIGSLETIKSQLRMDKKLNSIRRLRCLTPGQFILTAPLRFTGTLGAVRNMQIKAYEIEKARKAHNEKIETFMTLEEKESATKDFIVDYNALLENINNNVTQKSDSEIMEKYKEDSGQAFKVGDKRVQFGKDIKTPKTKEEIKTNIMDNVLLKVAANNKVLDIKDLNLNSNKIQTEIIEEFKKVGVLDEAIVTENFEIDKTEKLNLDKLEERINVIAKENPKAVEETIAKEVIVEYMEKNGIEDQEEIKKAEHKEKIKKEIFDIIEKQEEKEEKIQEQREEAKRSETLEMDEEFFKVNDVSEETNDVFEERFKQYEKEKKKEEREKIFEDLIESIEPSEASEPTMMDDILKNELIAEEMLRQAGIEREALDAQLRGFEELINNNNLETLEDVKVIEDYIENQTSPEIDDLLTHLLTLKEQDMAAIALEFKPNSYEQKRMAAMEQDRISKTYKKKI